MSLSASLSVASLHWRGATESIEAGRAVDKAARNSVSLGTENISTCASIQEW